MGRGARRVPVASLFVSADELRRRLDEYRRVRELACWLGDRLEDRRDVFLPGAVRKPRRPPDPQLRL